MRWSAGDRSNIEDRRGSSGLRTGVPLGLGGIIVLALLSWATGTDFLSLLSSDTGPAVEQTQGTGAPVSTSPEEERTVDFVDAVMRDVQTTWSERLGDRYQKTTLVLFRDETSSRCGEAETATGPFYCPGDRKVFIDLGFFDELRTRFGAPGDFAQAYVLAHEVGHHVQTLLGIERQVRAAQQQRPSQANALSVGLELQADCLAGVWGHDASQQGRFLNGRIELEPGDVKEGLDAAASVGDDRLQRMATGRVFPDKFTHGSSAQRTEWFQRGLQSGTIDACNTFGTM